MFLQEGDVSTEKNDGVGGKVLQAWSMLVFFDMK